MKILILILSIAIFIANDAEAGSKVKTKAVAAFSAKSFLVADGNGTVIKEHNSNSILPIASITKLIVGLLAAEQDLTESLSIPSTRLVQSSIPRKTVMLTRKELLILALVRSDNFAAQILCNNIPRCIEQMNNRAKELGMVDTQYSDPTGLDNRNVSTADDLLKLMLAANANPVVGNISSMSTTEIYTGKTFIKVNNTNPLTSKFGISVSKTGYTTAAGGCLVMIMNSSVGQRILILLGSKNARTRIPDMEQLVKEL